jgi:23S rRNA (uracil1939-C5)-methyltransferase
MPLLRVDSIAAGGDGIGRLDGLAVFVPRTAPGDVVDTAIRQQGRLARGRVLRVIEPSADRVAPACRHYDGDRCGGCQLQHLSASAQLDAKRRIVSDAFARIARRAVDVPPVVPSPSNWEYRSRLTLAMRWQGASWIMGLHAYDDVDRVFDLHECPITDPRIVDAWQAIRLAHRFLPRVSELRGTVRRLGDELGFVLEDGHQWLTVREFADAVPGIDVITWRPANGPSHVLVDRRTGKLPGESFDQVNQPVATAARSEILERALAGRPATAVDAYAGLGATSRALAERGVRVTAIELDPHASAYAASQQPVGGRVITGRVEDHLAATLPADVVILNPPRAGVDVRVTEALSNQPPRRVLYMSCNPGTLARDVSRLPGFRVNSVRGYDMFPQTAHVEVVCEMVPEDA